MERADILEFREIYREHRDETMELVNIRLARAAGPDKFEKLERVANLSIFKTIVFEMLLARYRLAKSLSRRDIRRQMLEGTFWEDFLEFLQTINWDEVLAFVLKIVELIIAIA